jgi:Protein of unknown function (DUF3574)
MRQAPFSWVLAGLVLAAPLSACAPPPAQTACRDGFGSPALFVTLYFGRSVPGGGEVSDIEFAAFTEQVLTTNLPNGHTAHDATGAWRNPQTQLTIRERTKVLTVALSDTPESAAAIQRIRTAYQRQFKQLLVGMTVHPACAAF